MANDIRPEDIDGFYYGMLSKEEADFFEKLEREGKARRVYENTVMGALGLSRVFINDDRSGTSTDDGA